MKPGDKNALVAIVACLFFLTFIFAKPLGIPDPWDLIPAMVGLVLFYFFFRWNKKIMAEQNGKQAERPVLTLAARKKRFWLMAVFLVVGTVAAIPLAPYMVDNFRSYLYYYLIPADFIFLGIILFILWRKLVGSAKFPK
jgi:hypothetical protein